MITQLFDLLTGALQGAPLIALIAAFMWGILSILLSPCHLASIPLIVGFISNRGQITKRKAFILSLLFSVGILVTITVIGIITACMGKMLGDIGVWGNYVVAFVFLAVGLHLLGIIPLPLINGAHGAGMKRKGFFAAFILGLIFGIALGPCTFAYMAPMLAITFSISSTRVLYGILLLTIYGIGHCSIIVFAGTFTEVVERYLKWNESSKGPYILKKICGVLIISAAIYMAVSAVH